MMSARPGDCRSSLLSRAHTVICVPGQPEWGRRVRRVTLSGKKNAMRRTAAVCAAPSRRCPGRLQQRPVIPGSAAQLIPGFDA